MTESAAPLTDADDWVIDRLFGEDSVPSTPQPQLLDSDSVAEEELSPTATADVTRDAPDETGGGDANAGAKHTAVWLGAALLAASTLIVGAFALSGGPSPSAGPRTSLPARSPTPVSAAPRTGVASAAPDQAISFTAAAPGCKSGSTPAQMLSDNSGDSPWVCVRGTPGEQADGQVIHIDFRCGAGRPTSVCSFLVTSVSVTPGSVSAIPRSRDGWLAHRVVSRLQYNFYNGGELADILTQDTGNVHGPAPLELGHPVLASRVVVIVLQTARPPLAPAPSSNPGAASPQPGLADTGPGFTDTTVPTPSSTASDPVDATFALSGMQFFGHQPK